MNLEKYLLTSKQHYGMQSPIPSREMNQLARLFAKEIQRIAGVDAIFVFWKRSGKLRYKEFRY